MKKIRVNLTDGNSFEFEVPNDFEFRDWAMLVHNAKAILTSSFFIPYDGISSIFMHEEDGTPIKPEKIMGTLQ